VSGPVILRLARSPAAVPVARRVAGALGARADLPVDRLEDAMIVAELLAVHGPAHSPGGRACVRMEARPGELGVEIGPLLAGGPEGLVADSVVDGVGPLLARLADEAVPTGEGAALRLVIRAAR
jgi:serine/threonine-protein kinase RsbW